MLFQATTTKTEILAFHLAFTFGPLSIKNALKIEV